MAGISIGLLSSAQWADHLEWFVSDNCRRRRSRCMGSHLGNWFDAHGIIGLVCTHFRCWRRWKKLKLSFDSSAAKKVFTSINIFRWSKRCIHRTVMLLNVVCTKWPTRHWQKSNWRIRAFRTNENHRERTSPRSSKVPKRASCRKSTWNFCEKSFTMNVKRIPNWLQS